MISAISSKPVVKEPKVVRPKQTTACKAIGEIKKSANGLSTPSCGHSSEVKVAIVGEFLHGVLGFKTGLTGL